MLVCIKKFVLGLFIASVILLLLQTTLILKSENWKYSILQTTSKCHCTQTQFATKQPDTMPDPEAQPCREMVHKSQVNDSHQEDRIFLPRNQDGHWLEPMVVSLDYREQTANALASLFDLQCWASTMNIGKVVEPSIQGIRGSVLHFLSNKNRLKFSDLFDLNHWNKMSIRRDYSPLVSTEHFLKHAIRDVVFVQIVYRLHPVRCLPESAIKKEDWHKLFMANGFHIVEIICIDFVHIPKQVLAEESFRDRIFQHMGHNVTVLFNVWEGIRAEDNFRVALKGSKCSDHLYKMANVELSVSQPSEPVHIHRSSSSPIAPSQQISELTERTLSEFLSGKRYIAIMMRTEKMYLAMDSNKCAKEITSDWKRLKNTHNITKTLFFSDADSHGSTTLIQGSQKRTFAQNVRDSLHLELTTDKINVFLEKITASRDSVLIAVLTRQIVAHATCVMTIGGGLFQRQALNMFAHNHRDSELCYSVRNNMCDSEYISHVYGSD